MRLTSGLRGRAKAGRLELQALFDDREPVAINLI
jgi:hypothetical protein